MTRQPEVYAQAAAEELLEMIPIFNRLGCDLPRLSVAYVRADKGPVPPTHMTVDGVEVPMTHFPRLMLVLSPLVKEAPDGSRTLQPFADLIEKQRITHVRAVGHGPLKFEMQVSTDFGQRWRRLTLSQQLPPRNPHQPAPVPTQEVIPSDEPTDA